MASALDDVQSLLNPQAPLATADEEMIIGTETPAPAAPKRPRGRPRKVPGEATTPDTGSAPKPRLGVEIPMPPKGVLASGVANAYVFAGMGVGMVRPQTGMTLAANAEECGKAWETLAEQNPAVRRALLSLLQTSAWGGIIAVHIPIVMMAVQEGQQIAAAKKEEKDAGTSGSEGSAATLLPFRSRPRTDTDS